MFRKKAQTYGLELEKLPNDAKNKIVPKDLRSCKIQLHSGETALLYTTEGEKPVWLKLREGALVPTVLTLWGCPYLLKKLYTPIYTIERLQNGADLMVPGVFDPLPENCPTGTVVAIHTVQSPTVPLAVGVTLTNCSDITEEQTGKAAYIVNVVGDTLLEGYRGDKKVPTKLDLSIPSVDESVETESSVQEESTVQADRDTEKEPSSQTDEAKGVGQDDCVEESADKLAELLLEQEAEEEEEEEENKEQNGSEGAAAAEATINEESEEPNNEAVEQEQESNSGPSFTTEEIDGLFYRALLQVLRKAIDTPLELPIPGSLFLSQHLLPNLAYQDAQVNMKATSYRKAQKFFKAMEKKKLLKCRERNGEVVVQSVAGKDAPEVRDFTIYKVKKTKSTSGTQQSNTSKSASGKMVAREYWKPRSITAPLFREHNLSETKFYPTDTLKKLLSTHVEKHGLGSGKNVKMDDVLASALSSKNGASLSREELLPSLQKNCTLNHTITPPGEEEPKLAKGPIPKVQILIERRGGNKIVTRISNVEPFHINPVTLAEELRVHCAGATSTSPIREGSDLKEVMVQGPQQKAVIKLLEEKGFKPTWITTTDKTIKKKKK
ncbi:hypothetical protein TRICI_001064 [Trichomonascus ciferrii]|uniref:SUI1 domain-containing protein n=1 Tax=Trichomonascus ciferrii TaxID=44093 RepID=A0A642VBK3_9ASCO|nr:hypothetical protein TRICI_001064 [Trichomonascus ciferrii]